MIVADRPLAGFLAAFTAVTVDFVDGEVARLQERASPFGNYLDAVVDRCVEVVLLVALAPRHPLAAASALGLGLLVSYVKARVSLVVLADNHDWPGIGDRADRVVFMLMAIAFLSLPWGVAGRLLSEWALWAGAAVSAVGIVQRFLHARTLVANAQRSDTLLPYLRP